MGLLNPLRLRSRPPRLLRGRWDMPRVLLMVSVLGIAAIVVVMFFALQPSHKEIVAPDGRPAILVKCSSQAGCYERAAEVCPSGYTKLDEQGHTKKHTTYQKVGDVSVPTEYESYDGMMLIRCN
jgi:hypothetical protein